MKRNYKIYVLLWLFVIIITNCNSPDNNANSEVIVKSNKDTVEIGEEYKAEIFVPITQDSIFPAFYIIMENDTVNLFIDQERKCGVYRASGQNSCIVNEKGFVLYYDQGEQIKADFFLNFVIKDTIEP